MSRKRTQHNTPRDRTPTAAAAATKRIMDITGALLGLALTAPLIAGAALYIKLMDPGPAFFTQWRVGRHGRLFRMHKLRTMRTDAERRRGAVCATPDDARVIPGCRWMRRSHLDELPQLFHILIGQMSLVGPRPERPEIFYQLRRTLKRFELRLAVRPGLTGLSQIRVGYARRLTEQRRKLAYDLRYIRSASTWTDFKLVLATFSRLWDPTAG